MNRSKSDAKIKPESKSKSGSESKNSKISRNLRVKDAYQSRSKYHPKTLAKSYSNSRVHKRKRDNFIKLLENPSKSDAKIPVQVVESSSSPYNNFIEAKYAYRDSQFGQSKSKFLIFYRENLESKGSSEVR